MSEGIRIEPGREEEVRYLQGWLAFSDRLDRMIEATEPSCEAELASAPARVPSGEATYAVVCADTPQRRQHALGPLECGIGQALQRIGEGLNAWGGGTPAPDRGASRQPDVPVATTKTLTGPNVAQ